MKTTLLTLDKPNHNGRIYPKEVIQRMIENIDERRCFLAAEVTNSPEINIERVCGRIKNLAIEEDCLVGDVELLHSLPACDPNFDALLKNYSIAVRPSGLGTISADGTIGSDYTLNYFFITDNPA